jgi:molecular chaperone GrpE
MNKRKRTVLEEKWAATESAGEPGEEQAAAPSGGDAAGPGDRGTELEREVSQLREQLLRQKADMANFRRRTERDRADVRASAGGAVIRELLPVIDDFERAVGAATDNFAGYREGVELILKSLHDSLTRLGVSRIDPAGEPFDPHLHEAVEQRFTSEVEAGTVVEVYGPGYQLGERLLRPASVAVAAALPTGPSGDDV